MLKINAAELNYMHTSVGFCSKWWKWSSKRINKKINWPEKYYRFIYCQEIPSITDDFFICILNLGKSNAFRDNRKSVHLCDALSCGVFVRPCQLVERQLDIYKEHRERKQLRRQQQAMFLLKEDGFFYQTEQYFFHLN